MKTHITGLAVAATLITAAALLGLFQPVNIDTGTGVAWSQVVYKVRTSPGVIYRLTGTDLNHGADYAIVYDTPRRSRTDYIKGGQITASRCHDGGTMQRPRQQAGLKGFEYLIRNALARGSRELGRRTIEGVVCDGLEATDPAVLGPLAEPADHVEGRLRLWVDAETEYPVRIEWNAVVTMDGEESARRAVMNRFQWNVPIDPRLGEPGIRADQAPVAAP